MLIFVIRMVAGSPSMVLIQMTLLLFSQVEIKRHLDYVGSAEERHCHRTPSGLLQVADYFKRVFMMLVSVVVVVMRDEERH